MIGVALKGLAGRKVRALLTAFAVVIGVSMVSGTFVLTDTMQKAFDGIFDASYEHTDAVITGKQIVEGSSSGAAPVPEALLAKVQALPEVEAAGGTIGGDESSEAELIGKDGKALNGGGAPALGIGYDATLPQFNPLKLKAGEWPEGSGQIVIDAGTAGNKGYDVGDSVRVSAHGETKPYDVTGIATYGNVDSLGGATLAVFDQATARTVLHKEGVYDGISIAAKDGTSRAELVRAVEPLVPASLQVRDAAAQAKEQAKDTNEGLSFIRYFLLGFGGIALFVGAFVIFNTLSITVAQRTREFATLRTLGASRKQVMRSVVVEGLVIGLVASLVGLVLGLGIAKGINALFKAVGTDLPESGTVLQTRTIIVSLLLGTLITLLASVMPARRATRVPPIAAVREGATLPASRLAGHSLKAAVGIVAASIAAISTGVFAGGLNAGIVALLLGGGILTLFVGVALAAPHLVKILARIVGWPARRAGGVAGELAGANSVRNPGRTASTAAALMVGLTLVTVVAVLGAGLRSSVESAVTDQVRAAYVLDGNDGEAFAAAEGEALARVPGVEAASHVRNDVALVAGTEQAVTGIDPATLGRFYRFDWTDGSAATLDAIGTDGALVTKGYAEDEQLAVGDRVAIQTASGDKLTVVVRGIHDPPQIDSMLGNISISQQAFDATFPQPKNVFTFLDAGPEAEAPLSAAAAGFNDATFHTAAAFGKDRTENFAQLLMMLYVLLAFSVVVSLFGMVNTMVLSVFERTRELGMLRTIGMTRRQARRMIRHESVITALIGAALGLPLGVFLAALVTQALSQYDVGMSIPVVMLAAFTVVAILAGVAAAILPARRASRRKLHDHQHYEMIGTSKTAPLPGSGPAPAPSPTRRGGRSRETVLFLIGIALIALHVLDDNFVQPQPGTSPGDHLVSGLVPLALLGVAAWVYPRLRGGRRGALALGFGVLGIAAGLEGYYYAREVGPSGDDFTGLLCIPAGVLLLGLGVVTLWRTRRTDGSLAWRYPRRALLGVAGVFVGMAVLLVGYMYGTTHLARPFVPTAQLGAAYEDVKFTTGDGLELEGWYVPSKNGAAVISFPGRAGAQKQARMLVRHGYGVLLFDRRGEGASDGDPNAWGWGGDKDVKAAIAYLQRRSDVQPDRIGAIGRSVGGEMLLETAAETDDLAAVVSDGAGARSYSEDMDHDGSAVEKVIMAPYMALKSASVAVFSNTAPPEHLKDLVPRIAPRPMMLIADPVSPNGEDLNKTYYQAAGEPKTLWEIPGAGHVGGIDDRPDEYERRVIGFFDEALLP